ncbi:hypothetical protein E4T66_14210 [Sinimarinibacterium sp. CAU 1509]|uniref:hypothetical protein n=1 Tax=Sinimarinibacterium sp. CAU 1509 TaxID=2562283 RepID=UPI0010ABA6B4|nr:hypothetical protein [Sinimarinibacterium sp. CAU 1509]TJY59527.1 hypothetical protein E4T66_14210 [Sinimarinibacterium sp. CAU 1509]
MPRMSAAWFTVVFGLSYIAIFALDLALFLYYPLVRQFSFVPLIDASSGPAMHWYGLMASAGCAGLAASVCLRDRWIPEVLLQWLWIVPVSAMFASAFLLRQFFA